MDSSDFYIEMVDLKNPLHCSELLSLLNDYMEDEMGCGKPISPGLAERIIEGLKKYPCYLGFFIRKEEEFAGLANCNNSFSTFNAAPLINIHDFIVKNEFRKQGAGKFLLESIIEFAKENGYCRINLEVREDNIKAKSLYLKTGFKECQPPMHFWEKRFL